MSRHSLASQAVSYLTSPPLHSKAVISAYTTARGSPCPENTVATSRKRSLETSSPSSLGSGCGKDGATGTPPSPKRLKVAITSFNLNKTSDETRAHMEEQMLHLARTSRKVYAAKIHYQRLRMEELDVIKSIMQDELEVSQVSFSDTERQIGQIRQQRLGKPGGIAGNTTSSLEQWSHILDIDSTTRADCDSDSDAASSACAGSE